MERQWQSFTFFSLTQITVLHSISNGSGPQTLWPGGPAGWGGEENRAARAVGWHTCAPACPSWEWSCTCMVTHHMHEWSCVCTGTLIHLSRSLVLTKPWPSSGLQPGDWRPLSYGNIYVKWVSVLLFEVFNPVRFPPPPVITLHW